MTKMQRRSSSPTQLSYQLFRSRYVTYDIFPSNRNLIFNNFLGSWDYRSRCRVKADHLLCFSIFPCKILIIIKITKIEIVIKHQTYGTSSRDITDSVESQALSPCQTHIKFYLLWFPAPRFNYRGYKQTHHECEEKYSIFWPSWHRKSFCICKSMGYTSNVVLVCGNRYCFAYGSKHLLLSSIHFFH